MTLATPADLVRGNAATLLGFLPLLEDEITEPFVPGGAAVGMAPYIATEPPFPGNSEAFGVLMVIWEAIPRLEASIRLETAGNLGMRRGGSPGNFLDALKSIITRSGGLDEDGEALVAYALEQLNDLARRLPCIDEAQRWRSVQSRACPACGCFFLKVLEDARGQPAGRVECWGHTETGPCRAAWPGLIEIARDLED